MTKCKLCLQGIGKIDYNELTQTEAAKRYGVSRRSVGRHNEHASKEQYIHYSKWKDPITIGDAHIIIDGAEKARTSDELKAADKHNTAWLWHQ